MEPLQVQPCDGVLRNHLARLTTPVVLMADQAASSLTNFLVLAIAARDGVEQFGRFSLAWLLVLATLGVCRAGVAEPSLIGLTKSRSPLSSSLDYVLLSVFIAAAGGLLAGIAMAITVSTFGLLLLPLTMCLVAQDGLRFVHFAAGRPNIALRADCAWLIVQVSIIGIAMFVDVEAMLPLAVTAWAAGMLLSALMLIRALDRPERRRPSASRAFSDSRSLISGTVPQGLVAQADSTLINFFVVLTAGYSTLGVASFVLRGLASPILSLLQVLNVVLIPRLTLALPKHRIRTELQSLLPRLSGGLLAAGVAFWLFGPTVASVLTAGQIAEDRGIFLAGGVLIVLQGLAVVPAAVLKAAERGRVILGLQLMTSVLSVTAASVGGWAFGAIGVVYGLCAAWACLLVAAWFGILDLLAPGGSRLRA